MSIEKLNKDIKNKVFDSKKIVVLHGDENLIIQNLSGQVVDSLLENDFQKQLDYQKIDFHDSDESVKLDLFTAIVNSASCVPMSSKKRVVRVSSFENNNDNKYLKSKKIDFTKLLNSIPETACVLFTIYHTEDSKNPQTIEYLSNISFNDECAFYELGKLTDNSQIKPTDFITNRISNISNNRIKVDAKTAEYIVEKIQYKNSDSSLSLFEVENMLTCMVYASTDETIQKEVIDFFAHSKIENTAFEISDLILRREFTSALEMCEKLFNNSKKDFSVFTFVGLIATNIEFLLGYLEYSAEGKDLKTIANKLELKNDYRLKINKQFLSYWNALELRKFLAKLYTIETWVKSGLYSERLAVAMLFCYLKTL